METQGQVITRRQLSAGAKRDALIRAMEALPFLRGQTGLIQVLLMQALPSRTGADPSDEIVDMFRDCIYSYDYYVDKAQSELDNR